MNTIENTIIIVAVYMIKELEISLSASLSVMTLLDTKDEGLKDNSIPLQNSPKIDLIPLLILIDSATKRKLIFITGADTSSIAELYLLD